LKKIQIAYNIFRDSPPTTPQRHRNAERQRERESRQMLTPEHRRTPIAHPAAIPFALAPARLTSSAAPAPSVPSASASASAPVTFNNQTYHHLTPSLAAQLAALPPMPTPVRGRGRGRGRATNPASNAAPGPSRISMQSQVSYFLFLKK